MGINFQGVSSFMALLALQKKLPFSGGGVNNACLPCTGGSGPYGRPEVASGRGMPPGSAML